MPSSSPEQRLVDRASEGDLRAMEEVVGLVEKPLRAYLALISPADLSVNDLAQDALVIGLRRIGSLQDPSALVAFFRGIAKNLVRSEIRKLGRRHHLLNTHLDTIVENLGHTGERLAEMSSQTDSKAEALVSCLRKLSEENRAMLLDYHCSGTSSSKIAEKTNRSEGAVHALLYRIRKSLRECIAQESAISPSMVRGDHRS